MNDLSRYSSENLKSFVTNFKTLAHAQDGQRGRIDVVIDPKTKKRTYQVSINYQKPATWWGKILQNTQRSVYGCLAEGHSSDDFFNKLKELFQDAKTCIENMRHETDTKKSKRLYRLKEAIHSSEEALNFLLTTYTTGSSSYFTRSQNDRAETAEQIRKDYQALATHIKGRVESVVQAAEEKAEEQVQLLIQLLFPQGKDNFVADFHTNATIPCLNKKGVQTALSKQFGDAFIAQIFEFYGVNKKEIEIISPTKVKCLIVGVLANLNLGALQTMKSLGKNSFFAQFLAQYHENVQEWTDEQLCECLARLRNISEDWIKNSLIEKQPQFLKDLKFLRACRSIVSYMPIHHNHRSQYFEMEAAQRRNVYVVDKKDKLYYLRHFGEAQFDAQRISYNLCRKDSDFIEGVLYPNFVNNRLKCFEAYKVVAQPGLYAIGTIPARGIEDQRSPEDPPYVDNTPSLSVIFRGSSDADSWWRNLSPTERTTLNPFPEGPGSKSYEEAMLRIHVRINYCLDKLKEKFPQPGRKFKIKIKGHSLAGTDKQRCLKNCAIWLESSKVSCISAVETYGFNSPGVEHHIAEEFIQLVPKLPHIQFTLRYFKADFDIVQQFGVKFMGWLPKNTQIPANLRVSFFKFSWMSHYAQSTCVQTTQETGCVTAVKSEVAGRLEAHQLRCLEYTQDREVYCDYLKSNNPDDLDYIKIGKDMDSAVKNIRLNTAEEIDEQAMSGLFLRTDQVMSAAAKLGGCAPES